jgi:hypothetical protein
LKELSGHRSAIAELHEVFRRDRRPAMLCEAPESGILGWKMRLVGVGLAAVLAGCSAPPAYYEPEPPQGQVPTREVIAASVPKAFAASANPRNILVSAPQPAVETGTFGWIVCVRAQVTLLTGADGGYQTVVIFFQRQNMITHRRAEPQDKCEGFAALDIPAEKK